MAFEAQELLTGLVLMGIGAVVPLIFQIHQKTRDLHVWHSPDESGTQSWKLSEEKLTRAVSIAVREAIRQLKQDAVI